MIARHRLAGELAGAIRGSSRRGTVVDEVGRRPAVPVIAAETIRRRRSRRAYGPQPVRAEVLAAAVDAGLNTAAALWGDAASGLAVHVLADRVSGHPQGLLHSDLTGSGGAVRWIAPLPAPLPELVLQADLGSAAAVVVWTGRLREAVAAQGAHGYRLLLTQAGAAASACLLRAEDAGLAGCLFDGLLPAGRYWPDGPDGFVELALLAVAIGVPVNEPANTPDQQPAKTPAGQPATTPVISTSGNESRDVR